MRKVKHGNCIVLKLNDLIQTIKSKDKQLVALHQLVNELEEQISTLKGDKKEMPIIRKGGMIFQEM